MYYFYLLFLVAFMYCLVYYFYLLFLVAFMYSCDAMNDVPFEVPQDKGFEDSKQLEDFEEGKCP